MNGKLVNGLSISYNGHYIRHSLKKKSSVKGSVLTDTGQVYARDNRSDYWEHIRTPVIFYFYDIESEVTYLVNYQEKCIQPVVPEGRILDCTDLAIYDIIDGFWCPVYDIGNRSTQTILRSDFIQENHSTQNYQFELVGNPIGIVDELSQLSEINVNLEMGQIVGEPIEQGQCKVLAYKTKVGAECFLIIHIFIRETPQPRFSAIKGNLELSPTKVPVPEGDLPNGFLSIEDNLYQFVDWEFILSEPNTVQGEPQFNIITGAWSVPRTGDYQIAANIQLQPITEPGEPGIPSALLIEYSSIHPNGIIRTIAPIRNESGSFNLSLKLKMESTLVLYLVAAQEFETIPLATTFNGHYLGA
jgi:hypothetical protein